METYSDSEDTLRQSFLQFLEHVSADGVSILCSDDANIQSISSQLTCKKIFYGVNDSADYLIHDYNQNGLSSSAILSFNSNITRLKLNLPGLYNIKNAVAAAIAANCIGIDWDTITKACSSFKGVGRRFQLLGDVKAGMKQLTIFEDYGHHPTEVKVAYEAAVNAFTDKKVILVFQPHRYTRTRDLMSEFVDVLSCVSSLVLLPTYSASEDAIAGATSEDLFNELKRNGKSSVVYADNSESLMYILEELSNNGDVVIFQGAGDVSYVAKRLVSKYGIKNEK